jgi:hypothetical protein
MAENRIDRELQTREKTVRKSLGSARKLFRRQHLKTDIPTAGFV